MTTTSLERRLEVLEKQAGSAEEFRLCIVSFVGCDPDKMGPARAIEYKPTGYRDMSGSRFWEPRPSESIDQLRRRMEAELIAEGRSVFVAVERYDCAIGT